MKKCIITINTKLRTAAACEEKGKDINREEGGLGTPTQYYFIS